MHHSNKQLMQNFQINLFIFSFILLKMEQSENLTSHEKKLLKQQLRQQEREQQASIKTSSHNSKRNFKILISILIILAISYTIYRLYVSSSEFAVPPISSPHVPEDSKVTYSTYPPTSGPHAETAMPQKINSESIQEIAQVHHLEHGGVLIQYNCPDPCPDLISQLTTLVNQYPKEVVLAPYNKMSKKIAATAWGRLYESDTFDEATLKKFIEKYMKPSNH